MYVAAQRVRSPGGSVGVNAFLFLHGDEDLSGVSWMCPDVDAIADKHPGTLVLQRVEQPSGGNEVLSYIDIAAHDSLGLERLARILLESPPPLSNNFAWSVGAVSLRFVSQSMGDLVSEFSELRKYAMLLLDPERRSTTTDAHASAAIFARDIPGGDVSKNLFLLAMGDVEIVAQDVPGVGIVYRLGAETSARFLENGVLATPATIHAAYEALDDLKRIWGNEEYHRQIALALTGLSRDALRELGGYRVQHQPQQLLGPMASSRDIPGQIEGYWIGPGLPMIEPSGWPTGALLRSNDGERALDLVFVEQAWFPLSEAALYTYQHTTGLQGGELWRFLRKGSTEAFEVAIGPSLTRGEVAQHYGPEASARSRPDYKTLQLRVTPLPR